MDKKGCIFCKIANKEMPARIVHDDGRMIAFEDVNPQAPVHCVIIPKAHIERLSDVTAAEAPLVGEMALVASKIAAEKGIAESGYRIVINCNKDAGQAVFHIHMHLLGGRHLSWPPG